MRGLQWHSTAPLPPFSDDPGTTCRYSVGMTDVSHLLEAAAAGDRKAAADLLPLVYDELRQLAAARMAIKAPGHILDATALVHEAYIRLVGDQHFDGPWVLSNV